LVVEICAVTTRIVSTTVKTTPTRQGINQPQKFAVAALELISFDGVVTSPGFIRETYTTLERLLSPINFTRLDMAELISSWLMNCETTANEQAMISMITAAIIVLEPALVPATELVDADAPFGPLDVDGFVRISSGMPQLAQNLASSVFSAPHLGQNMSFPSWAPMASRLDCHLVLAVSVDPVQRTLAELCEVDVIVGNVEIDGPSPIRCVPNALLIRAICTNFADGRNFR
jgi:hypothetical protein